MQTKLFEFRQTLFSPLTIFEEKKKLAEKIDLLEKEKAELLEKVGQLGALKEENANMRRLLGSSLPAVWHFEPARVIYQVSDTIYLTSSYEPPSGTAVIAGPASAEASARQSGILVGRSQEVNGGTVAVFLPTNTNSKIKVFVRDKETGEEHGSGILEGRGGRMLITQVLASEEVSEGDLVLTSGENLPPSLLVGYVDKIFETRERAWKEADVKMALDPKGLKTVFFVTKF